MTRHQPQTYIVTCSPGLMTDAELRRELSNAEARHRSAETDSSADAWGRRAEELYAELERRNVTEITVHFCPNHLTLHG